MLVPFLPFFLCSYLQTRYNLGSPFSFHSYDPIGRKNNIDSAYWTISGNAIIDRTGAILTVDKKSLNGGFWNSLPVGTRNWAIEFEFSCCEFTNKIHGEGLAFWYVPYPLQPGNAFGADPHYTGAVVSFDTYQNKNHASRNAYPYLSLHVSDGTKPFVHDHDGINTEIAGCTFDYSGKGRAIRIYYIGIQKKLIVDVRRDYNVGFVNCFEADEVVLPTGYKFGFTAATGELSDLHKINKVLFYSLDSEVKETSQMHEFDMLKPYARQKVNVISTPKLPDSNYRGKNVEVSTRSIFREFMIVLVVLGVFVAILFIVHKALQVRRKRMMKRLY